MEVAIESVLEQRSRLLAARLPRIPSLLISVALHVISLSSLVIVPLLAFRQPEPIEFTPITIVPLQALGIEAPSPAVAQEEAPPAPEPERPVLPEPDKKPTIRSAEPPPPDVSKETASTPAAPEAGALARRQGSPLGSSLGTSAFGATVGGLDNPDFVYGYYVDQMLAMISAHWRRPSLGGEVTAIVHFRIHRDGHISDVRVAQSSGYNSYDLAGLRAVQLAAPFPKLPQSFRHNSLGVNLVLR